MTLSLTLLQSLEIFFQAESNAQLYTFGISCICVPLKFKNVFIKLCDPEALPLSSTNSKV